MVTHILPTLVTTDTHHHPDTIHTQDLLDTTVMTCTLHRLMIIMEITHIDPVIAIETAVTVAVKEATEEDHQVHPEKVAKNQNTTDLHQTVVSHHTDETII